ncbi:molybdopterin-dependent oxidoreductase [Alcaligenaceae bacterium]|nr:molybdopterin-dependent oxidoreductase [Alcaligenaceae bacterium]
MCWLALVAGVIAVFWGLPASAQNIDKHTLQAPAGTALLIVSGAIEKFNQGGEAHFDRAMLEQLPSHEISTTTSVTDGVSHFKGPLLRDVLQQVGAKGTMVQAQGLNNYVVDIPISDFYDFDVLLALYQDGKQLEPSGKGPLWIVYPRDQWRRLQDIRYDYRWVWQLHRLDVK